MDKINELYTYLNSQQTAQYYLLNCYKGIPGIDAEAKSYENCNAFMYYLDHGYRFYESGKNVDLFARPVLYFYGMVHLLKACLLTKRPDYPESTSLLAHGASTRKRKKKNYTFMMDEVKVQHNGLFPYFSEHLFKYKNISFEKIKMEKLLALIPEMDNLFSFREKERMVAVSTVGSRFFKFPTHLLDSYHLTAKAFQKRMEPHLPKIKDVKVTGSQMTFEVSKPVIESNGPFFFHAVNNKIYFPVDRNHFLPISEVMVHYLLLYNLSMLCRYEAEWWGDLLTAKSEIDYPFIVHFLTCTAEKIPFLLGTELYKGKSGKANG